MDRVRPQRLWLCACVFAAALASAGCSHYPLNQPLHRVDPQGDYWGTDLWTHGRSEHVLLFLTFSGGGTRAAALSYGVLEELRETEVLIDGRKRRLLDEVDVISGVSGGSFTAGYYGLFGERIFEDFETAFLKRDVQGALAVRTFLSPVNRFRLFSPTFGRSDLAAEYYDRYVFEGGTFGDVAARKGPMILMNATDMTHGLPIAFTKDTFDLICSDLSPFPVGRAAAASSAVPVVLSPVTLRNHAGACGSESAEILRGILERGTLSERKRLLADSIAPLLDSQKKPYIHLVDGGVADNLGLRAILDGVLLQGGFWQTIQGTPVEDVRRVAFIIVNAETKPDAQWDRSDRTPPASAMISSYASIAIERYNVETVALIRESVPSWTDDIREQRCRGAKVSTTPGSCGDIRFYVIEVKFDVLEDEDEKMHFKRLPTSFRLDPEQVDQLREVARRILRESEEFQRFLGDLH